MFNILPSSYLDQEFWREREKNTFLFAFVSREHFRWRKKLVIFHKKPNFLPISLEKTNKTKKRRSLENKQSINLNLFSAFQQFLPFWMKGKKMEMPFFIFFCLKIISLNFYFMITLPHL